MRKEHISVIIAAGGKGSRMGMQLSKQYMPLNSKPVIVYSLEKFCECNLVDEIVAVVSDCDTDFFNSEILKKFNFKQNIRVTTGGLDRQSSVYNGLKHVSGSTDIILIHDAARPLVRPADIKNLIKEALLYPSCALGVSVKDTIKQADESGLTVNTPDRRYLYGIQTPQAFRYALIMEAHEKARAEGFMGTDDTSLTEYIGFKTKIIVGSYSNIKITTREDIIIAEALLREAEDA